MDTRKAIGHEYGPTPDATVTRRCPICGKPFVYAGGWCVGSTPVCSYSCQRQLVAQYKQSREYKRIQEELNPPKKPQRQRLISDIEVLEMPDGPLTRTQIAELHHKHPLINYTIFQELAELILSGNPSRVIMQKIKTYEALVHDVRAVLGYVARRGKMKALTKEQEREVQALRKAGVTLQEIADRYGVSRETVRRWTV